MGDTIKLTASDGFELQGYLAKPAGAGKGGIVVVQEIFGVNAHIREVCDRFAEAGYAALAPAIFDRMEPGFDVGYEPADMAKARQLMSSGSMDNYLLDVTAARDAMAGFSPVSITGYCLGGSVAFAAAARLDGFLCAVPFYGGMIAGMCEEKPRCPMLMYFGEQDHSIPMEAVDAIRKARPETTIKVVDAQHGFMCNHRATYSEEHAATAWEDTISFLNQQTGSA
ncbi:MAG: dienelactone hydrolase family protein [Gammaproteobacteria bacterium]|nr:dienelactone hydrolase family protein [Gammaproteobacteria bacterium]